MAEQKLGRGMMKQDVACEQQLWRAQVENFPN